MSCFHRGGNPFATVRLRPTVTNDRSAPVIWCVHISVHQPPSYWHELTSNLCVICWGSVTPAFVVQELFFCLDGTELGQHWLEIAIGIWDVLAATSHMEVLRSILLYIYLRSIFYVCSVPLFVVVIFKWPPGTCTWNEMNQYGHKIFVALQNECYKFFNVAIGQ